MAKGSKKSRSPQRDTSAIASPRTAVVGHHLIPRVTPALDQLSAIERARNARRLADGGPPPVPPAR